jgi:NAD-dependent dihydropyrimidine dehydrogenase PreA subunit
MSEAVDTPVSINLDLCNGCRKCQNSCPTDVFGFNEATQKSYLAYPGDCSVCFLCIGDCPTGAIKVDFAITSVRKHSAYAEFDPSELVLDTAML